MFENTLKLQSSFPMSWVTTTVHPATPHFPPKTALLSTFPCTRTQLKSVLAVVYGEYGEHQPLSHRLHRGRAPAQATPGRSTGAR